MSNDLDLTATLNEEIDIDSMYSMTYPWNPYPFIGFRLKLWCEPASFSNGVLARWSRLTRGVASLSTRREFARERANTLFRGWCAARAYMKESKHAQFETPNVSSWLFDASHITLDSHALTLTEVAYPFYVEFSKFAGWYVKMDMDYCTEPYAIACDALSDAARRRFARYVYTSASNSALREAATACADALQRATREVSDEYEREDAFTKALRRRGLPLQTARNWIVPREIDARLYVVDPFGNISGRDGMRVD